MKVVLMQSRRKALLWFVICLGFVAASVYLLTRPIESGGFLTRQRGGALACALLFGAGTLATAGHLMDRRPRMILNDEGIVDRTLGMGLIPWSAIQGAYLNSMQKNVFICLEVADYKVYLRRIHVVKRAFARVNRLFGFTPICLNLTGVAADPQEVLDLILKRIRAGAEKESSRPSDSRVVNP